MELLADRDPEEARKLLDPVLERMMEAVHHYEGTVNQVMGDGIMALFGAPIGHEDHAVRACYAALRMQRRVNLHADEVQQQGGTPVQIRVGVNSGEVVVRAIGSDLHMDYTAVGQTTHLAARMEQMAKPGSALITGATLYLAEGYVQVRPLGAVPVKGLEIPTPVYELTGAVPARSRLQASAARGLTRFVGRDRELEQLGQALERAAGGHGQAVAVVGEAGVGKSRLAWEFIRSHRTQGWLVLESGSVSYGKATPYLPVIELLKGYCRIQERDEPRAIRERVVGKLLTLDRALERLQAPLLALLDVPVDDARGCPRPAPTPSPDSRCGQAVAPPGEPGSAAARALRGPSLDRRGDPGVARRARREPARPLASCSSSTTGPSTSTPGAASPTTFSFGSTRCRPKAPMRSSRRSSGKSGASSPSSARWSSEPRGTPSSSRRASGPSWRPRCSSASVGRIGWRRHRTRGRSPPRRRRSWRRASTGWCPRTSEFFRPLRSSARTCRSRFCRPSRTCRRTPCAGVSATSRRPSSCTRRACSRISSTPSSTRSPTKSPTEACFTTVGARFTPGSYKPSRPSTASA